DTIAASNGVIHVIDSVLLPPTSTSPTTQPTADIVDTAVAAGSFKTLVAAAQAAGLVDALKGDGPLTVFAPTDDAFAKLPAGTVESLLKPENKGQLAAILKYHVVAGAVDSGAVVKLTSAKTLEGRSVNVSVQNGKVKINNANVVKVDIACSNGIVHVIDSVLLPPKSGNKVGQMMPTTMIESCVAKGAALYNAGHHHACADLYHKTMTEMMSMPMTTGIKSHMKQVMRSASHQHDASQRAWTLRRGLDQMYTRLVSHH
ncbi:MAG: fasciclin domain-containing protein, partial [Planctomycetota bacterium]